MWQCFEYLYFLSMSSFLGLNLPEQTCATIRYTTLYNSRSNGIIGIVIQVFKPS